jgi:myo-inositol-1(or 4)-monophosphatase
LPGAEQLRRDAALLFEAVREAGSLALRMQHKAPRRWTKGDGTPVSEADVAVDALLRGSLCGERPGYGWLSEETPDSERRLACEKLWVADPIDGTRSFVAGGGDWCIAVALVARGRPAAAAIYCPVGERFFAAVAGGGAHRNGRRLTASGHGSLAAASVVGTKRSLAPLAGTGIRPDISGRLPLQMRLAGVAAGDFDAAVSTGRKNDWDLAAGDLIVHEAGGLAGDLAGAPFVYNRPQAWQHGLIAAGSECHAAIAEALRDR